MDPASIIGLVSFAGACTKVFAKATYTVFRAPDEILALNNEVSELRVVLTEWSLMNPSKQEFSATAISAHETHVVRTRDLLGKLYRLVQSLYKTDANGKHHFQRALWLVRKNEAMLIKQEIATATQSLRDLMHMRGNVKLDRIELKLSNMDSVLAALTADSKSSTEPDSQAVSLIAHARKPCDTQCPCSCHYRYRLNMPSVAKSVLGQMFVGYIGLPTPGSTCSTASCVSSQVRSCRLNYTFPIWFIQRSLFMVIGVDAFGEPEFMIKTRNRRSSDSLQSTFQIAHSGKAEQLKTIFERRKASPNDVELHNGNTAFMVSPCMVCMLSRLT